MILSQRVVGTIVARRALTSITRRSLGTFTSSSSSNCLLSGEQQKKNDFVLPSTRTFRSKALAMPVRVVEVSLFSDRY